MNIFLHLLTTYNIQVQSNCWICGTGIRRVCIWSSFAYLLSVYVFSLFIHISEFDHQQI